MKVHVNPIFIVIICIIYFIKLNCQSVFHHLYGICSFVDFMKFFKRYRRIWSIYVFCTCYGFPWCFWISWDDPFSDFVSFLNCKMAFYFTIQVFYSNFDLLSLVCQSLCSNLLLRFIFLLMIDDILIVNEAWLPVNSTIGANESATFNIFCSTEFQ